MEISRTIRSSYEGGSTTVSAQDTRQWLLLVSLITTIGTSCGTAICENEIVNEAVAPGEKHVAVTFMRNCGATTPMVHVVSIFESSDSNRNLNDADHWVFTI